jgi:hypothetical protein
VPLDGQPIVASPESCALEHDLRTYFGSSGDRYVRFWRKHMAADGSRARFRPDRPSWLSGALLFGALWGLHRRLYGAVAIWAATVVALGLLFGGIAGAVLGLSFTLVAAAYARQFVIHSALRRIRRVDAKRLPPEARTRAIRRAGRTSIVAPSVLVAAVGGHMVLAAGPATSPKPGLALPDCDSPAVQAVVADLAAGALGKGQGLATLTAGSATEFRAETATAGHVIVRDCGAAVVVDGGASRWAYRVSWDDYASRRFRVDLTR